MDEADRILNMDFEQEVDKILRVIPRERTTYLYSATMTKKVRVQLNVDNIWPDFFFSIISFVTKWYS